MRFAIASLLFAIVPCLRCNSVCTEQHTATFFNRTFLFFFTSNVTESDFMTILLDHLPQSVNCNSRNNPVALEQSQFYFGGLSSSFQCPVTLKSCSFFVNNSTTEAQPFYQASLLNSFANIQKNDQQDVLGTLEKVIGQQSGQHLSDSTAYVANQIILVTDYVLEVLYDNAIYLEKRTQSEGILLFAFVHNLNESLYSHYLPNTAWSVNSNFDSVTKRTGYPPICNTGFLAPDDSDYSHSARIVFVALSSHVSDKEISAIDRLLHNVTTRLGNRHCTKKTVNVQFVFRDIYNQDNDDPTSFTCQ
uniref:Secreted protein n=1 Tax=Plectus sambesii TaxID=2011161 RepID=A0A914X134_9BILA